MAATTTPLTEVLQHVYWLGGGSGAGKSTIARKLAAKHGLKVYSTDDVMGEHARRCSKYDCPFLDAFRLMSMDERWVDRSPEIMLETFHWFRGEGFSLIVEDLLHQYSARPVIVEGFRLLPKLVKPLLQTSSQGLWLIPTPEFRVAAFESRGTLWDIANKTTDPKRALANLLRRDQMFAARVEQEAKDAGLNVIEVAPFLSENHLIDQVEVRLGLR